MTKYSLRFIAALLLALCAGCVAETTEEDDGVVEKLLVEDEHSPGVHDGQPVHIPTETTPQRHDPPPNPWQEEGYGHDDSDDPDIDLQQLPQMDPEVPR